MFVATRYATHQEVEFKCFKIHSSEWTLLLQRKGINLIFPDVLRIEAKLLNK